MQEATPFDSARLADWLRGRIDLPAGAIEPVRVGSGYSNPTFGLRGEAGDLPLILRKQPPGPLPKSTHAIDREYRVMKALEGSGVPVPKMIVFCDDPDVIGTPFYLMERVQGRVFTDNALPEVPREERATMYAAMADTLADLHKLDVGALGLGDFGRAGNFFDRQMTTWTRQHGAVLEAMGMAPAGEEIDLLMAWLGANRPAMSEETTIVHGDYRMGNLMFHPERPEIVAVLDWELSTLGHPLADLGYNLMTWVQRQDEWNGLGDVDLPAAGIPTMADHAARYLARRGLPAAFDPWFIAFSLFRLSVIFEGIVMREAAGAGTGTQGAHSSEYFARAFARHGLTLAGQ